MSAQSQPVLTEQAYLEAERTSDQKHEFYDGRAVVLAGGSASHNRIAVNIITSLAVQMQNRPCSVYASDMRVHIPAARTYVYPDVSVVCGQEHYADASEETLLNPVVIVEVLSPSTERHDRGRKFEYYRTIDSLQEYVLVAQETKRIDHFVRQAENLWVFSSIGEAEAELYLPAIDCTLTVRAIYQRITL